MMEKEFVTYEMAVKLKQLGFEEPCMGVYYGDEDDIQFVLNVRETQYYAQKGYKNGILVPTWQSAFRWFRNKHRIHFRIEKYDEGTWWVSYGSWTSDVFDSYEQAENKSLEKLIEFIEREK
jgi:hypothetical protein